MTNLETIAAAAVAIFGAWVFWPCLLFILLLMGFAMFIGGAYALDTWAAWKSRRLDARKRDRR